MGTDGISVPEGTPLKVKLQTTISTFSSKVGDPFQGKITDPVVIDGKTMIPAGATVEGRVTKLNEPRRIKGKPTIGIFPEHIVLPDGQRFMLNAVLVDTDIPGTDVNEEGQFKGSGHDRRDQIEIAGGTGCGHAARRLDRWRARSIDRRRGRRRRDDYSLAGAAAVRSIAFGNGVSVGIEPPNDDVDDGGWGGTVAEQV